MLCVSQAFLSQLFSKKQMLPRAVGAGRRHIKVFMYALKGGLSLPQVLSVHPDPSAKGVQHLAGGRASHTQHRPTPSHRGSAAASASNLKKTHSKRTHLCDSTLQNSDVQSPCCGNQAFTPLEVDAGGSDLPFLSP